MRGLYRSGPVWDFPSFLPHSVGLPYERVCVCPRWHLIRILPSRSGPFESLRELKPRGNLHPHRIGRDRLMNSSAPARVIDRPRAPYTRVL